MLIFLVYSTTIQGSSFTRYSAAFYHLPTACTIPQSPDKLCFVMLLLEFRRDFLSCANPDSNLFFFYIPNIHIINRYAVTFGVAATCLDLCAVNTEHPSPRLSYIRIWANIDNPICGWSRYVKISYTVPSIEACLFSRQKRARIGEENRWNNYFSPDETLFEIKKKEESNLKRVYIGPTRSCFKLHVTAVALHRLWSTDSRYLCWRTSKPAYIPSTGSTCCPCDIVVIINYKWVFTIGYENRLKSVCLVKRNRNYNKDIVIGNTGLLTLLLS